MWKGTGSVYLAVTNEGGWGSLGGSFQIFNTKCKITVKSSDTFIQFIWHNISGHTYIAGKTKSAIANRFLTKITLTFYKKLWTQWFLIYPDVPCSLLQLDANLIEWETYNRLAKFENKRRLKWRHKIHKYWKYGKPVFIAHQNKWHQWGPVWCHQHTVFFAPIHPHVGQKTSLVNLRLQLNYMDGIGTEYTSHDKELCPHSKVSKTTSKSINQIRPVLMPWCGVKKLWFFPKKRS